jgi:uncharacterized protein (TIGR02145 family)
MRTYATILYSVLSMTIFMFLICCGNENLSETPKETSKDTKKDTAKETAKDTVILPVIHTTALKIFSYNTVEIGGNITKAGNQPVTKFGICWGTSEGPTIAGSKTEDNFGAMIPVLFGKVIQNLSINTNYYIRAYATVAAGTVYGEEFRFTLWMNVPDADVTDIDGNVYHSVKIGTQVWMTKNLNVTHYRSRDPIPNVTDGIAWWRLKTGAYCNYNNDTVNSTVYGRLYNWYAVNDSLKMAPAGWHVASKAEWTILSNYLGGAWVAANKLMETGNTHWINPASTISNEAGFYALPGGLIHGSLFNYLGYEGHWWSSTQDGSFADNFKMSYLGNLLSSESSFPTEGYSVRCIKD